MIRGGGTERIRYLLLVYKDFVINESRPILDIAQGRNVENLWSARFLDQQRGLCAVGCN